MRKAPLITGLLGGAATSLFSLLMFYFSATGGFYGRHTLSEAIVLALMGATGLAGAVISTRSGKGGGWMLLASVLVGIYYLWDVFDLVMIIPTILLFAAMVTAFGNARSGRG